MRRFEAFERISEALGDALVVCNIGHPAQELFQIADRPKNFYMLGSMGMASSIGLGLAMATREKVIALDGDGAVLMNLGTLATIASVGPRNYVLIIVDNAGYGSTGFQKTFTAGATDLADVARGCGWKHVVGIDREDDIAVAVAAALASEEGPHCLVIRTEQGNPPLKPIPLNAMEIKARFTESLRAGDHG